MDSFSSQDLTTASTKHELVDIAWLDYHYRACQSEYEAMLTAVGLQAGWHVLDSGCGGGNFLPLMAQLVGPHGKISAVDLAPEKIAFVEAQLQTHHFAYTVETRVGDILALPYPDNTFDAVWNANVSQYLSEEALQTMLAEFRRVVRPGGLVAIKEFDATILYIDGIPPFTLMRRVESACRKGNLQMLGCMRASVLHNWLHVSNFTDIRRQYFITDRIAPLRLVEREYISSLITWYATHTEILQDDLPPTDLAIWRSLLDTRAVSELVNHFDFHYREGHVLIIGHVP